MGTNVNTGTITLQIDSSMEFLSTDFRQDRGHGAIAILEDFAEQRKYGEHERSRETCRIIKLTGYRKNVFLGDGNRTIL